MDDLEKTVVLYSSDEETTLKLGSTTAVCSCSKCEHRNSTTDASSYFTACSQLELSFVELSTDNSKNEAIKRSVSCSSDDLLESSNVKKFKTTIETSSQVVSAPEISKKAIFSGLIWDQDERLSKSIYYNRIDDVDFDSAIFISSLYERTIDKIIAGVSRFTLEHYYHREKKRIQVNKNKQFCQEIRENLKSFIESIEDNKTDLIWNEMQKQAAKRRLEDQIQITQISEEEYKSFCKFLDEIYQKFELLD